MKNEEKIKLRNNDRVKKLEYSDKYYVNNLQIENVHEEFGENVSDMDYELEQKKVNIYYIRISGLKNKNIEEKINNEIYEKVKTIYSKYENDEGVRRVDVYAYVDGNFADVLSVYINTYVEYKEMKDENIHLHEDLYSGLNYILETGEQIKFNELFTEDASIKNILSKATYEKLAYEYLYEERESDEEYFDGNMDTIDYSEIENNLLKIVSKYNQNNNIEFSFSPTNICAYIDSKNVYIDNREIRDSLAIFSRFLSNESLYENGNLAEKDYACNYPISKDEYIYEKISENIFVDIYAGNIEEKTETVEKTKSFSDRLAKKLKNELSNEKAYICRFITNYNELLLNTTADGSIIEIDREYYNKNKDLILYIYQGGFSGGEIYVSDEENKLIDEDKILNINYVSYKEDEYGNVVEIIEDNVENQVEENNIENMEIVTNSIEIEEVNNLPQNIIENIVTNEIN